MCGGGGGGVCTNNTIGYQNMFCIGGGKYFCLSSIFFFLFKDYTSQYLLWLHLGPVSMETLAAIVL